MANILLIYLFLVYYDGLFHEVSSASGYSLKAVTCVWFEKNDVQSIDPLEPFFHGLSLSFHLAIQDSSQFTWTASYSCLKRKLVYK